MKHRFLLTLLCLMALTLVAPAPASADVGSTIVARFWDSMQKTFRNRLESQAPQTASLLQEAEQIFLGETQDITTFSAVQDIFKGMRIAGMLLLALCTVISLAEVTEAGMLGYSSNLADWFKRFAIATFMTIGSIQFYGLWIRIFNALLAGLRAYLDAQWGGAADTGQIWMLLTAGMGNPNALLLLLFILATLAVLLILWFLIGGIRMAEMAIAVIIAPLVWPVYLIPSLEDIPKTAFRTFLGLNAVLLLIVAMLRLAIRMFIGGSLGHSVWNYIPALSVLMMTVFLPNIIKRLVGQGNTGAGGLMTVAHTLMGLKGLSLAASAAAAGAVRPPAAAAIPQTPSGPSMYPVAPVPMGGAMAPGGGARPGIPLYETWVNPPAALAPGSSPGVAGIEAPFSAKPGSMYDIDLGQSRPGSNVWDLMLDIRAREKGKEGQSKPIHDSE
ncbi:MAG: hypothetical protein ACOY94_06100 [Bacillota bacterium]